LTFTPETGDVDEPTMSEKNGTAGDMHLRIGIAIDGGLEVRSGHR